MKAPLPPPWPEPKDVKPKVITKRLEWDEAEQCFLLHYLTGLFACFRGGYKAGLYYPYLMLGLVIGQPAMSLFLLYGYLAQSKKSPNTLSIYEWGCRDQSRTECTEVIWNDVIRIVNSKDDIFIRRRRSITYIVRESFANSEEVLKFENILRELGQSNGANWNEVVAKYKT